MTIGTMPGHNEEETEDEIKVFKTEGGDGEPPTSSSSLAPDILAEDRNEIVKQVEIEGSKAPWAAAPKKGSAAQKRPSPSSGANGSLGGQSGSGTAFKAPVKSNQGPTPGVESSAASSSASGVAPHPFFISGASNGFSGAIPYGFFPMWHPGQSYGLPSGASGSGGGNALNNFLLSRMQTLSPGQPLSVEAVKNLAACSPNYGLSPHFAPFSTISPSFSDNFNAFSQALALQQRFSPGMPLLHQVPSPAANLSPLHSPDGTPIVPTLQPKGPTTPVSAHDMTALLLKQQISNAAGTNVNLPPSFPMHRPVPFLLSPAAFNHVNPLGALNQIRLPNATTNVTSLATSLASQPPHSLPRNQSYIEGGKSSGRGRAGGNGEEKREPHVKKPLNAFMIFMKENRAKLMEEKGYKERQSAELNKELGRLWHTLSQEEQQKYYQIARDERNKHMQMYPTWSARDNYAVHKKKKRKRDKTLGDDSLEMKKCRARFGLDKMENWCKHCKRKKKCLWFREGANPDASEQSPIQVSSTTQGSPTEGGADEPGAKKFHPSSPSAVTSSTTLPPARKTTLMVKDMLSSEDSDSDNDDPFPPSAALSVSS